MPETIILMTKNISDKNIIEGVILQDLFTLNKPVTKEKKQK